MKLDQEGICCSLGSSCTTGAVQPSHVLRALHFSNERARSSLRFSFGRYNTEAELDRVLEILPRIVRKLRVFRLHRLNRRGRIFAALLRLRKVCAFGRAKRLSSVASTNGKKPCVTAPRRAAASRFAARARTISKGSISICRSGN